MKKTLITAALVAVASPAAAWAGPPSHAGGPHGSPPGLSRDDDRGPTGDSPAAECFEERRDLGVSEFNDKYGTNENESNAFGKCVSEEAQERQDD